MILALGTMMSISLSVFILSPFWLSKNIKLRFLENPPAKTSCKNQSTLFSEWIFFENEFNNNKITEKQWLEKQRDLKNKFYLIQKNMV